MKTSLLGILATAAFCGVFYLVGDWLRLRRIVIPEWLAGLILVVGVFIACAIHICRDQRR